MKLDEDAPEDTPAETPADEPSAVEETKAEEPKSNGVEEHDEAQASVTPEK